MVAEHATRPDRAGRETVWRELRGVVERITFQNPENGFTVARLAAERRDAEAAASADDERLVTLVGTLPDLQPGEAIEAKGWWKNDPTRGWQFQAIDYRTALPATLQGMKRYLGSGLVKGIGPVMGGRIVDAFGEATFDVIDGQVERLTEVPGIGPIRAKRIAATWDEQRHVREVMAALQGHGVSTSLAVRIYKKFGDDSAAVIAKEPYRLAREVWGIGFKTADKIAQAVGIAPDAPERLQAGVLHGLGQAADEGHTLLPEDRLVALAAELLGADSDRIAAAIASLTATGELVAAGRDGQDGRLLALAPFARSESGLASRLQALAAAGDRARVGRAFAGIDWTVAFGWLAEQHGLTLAPEQEDGVRMVLAAPVSILTGGPGTGKTHTLRAVLLLAGAKRLRCVLAAPTGRAAKRMQEATGWPAGTLHRVLELRPGGRAGRNPDRPLEADLVVVDEASMLDALLANQLAKAVAPGAHLLLVGDPDQLPSVGAGDVLADLLRSERFPVTRLERIFRQGAGSGIAANATRINEGQPPRFGGEVGDCFFLPAEDPAEAARLVVDLVARRLPARYGFGAGNVQVLVPMHRGEAGVGNLNLLLQDRLNPATDGVPEARGGGRTYRPGDRVLQLKNDYGLEVFNGDLGTVRAVEPVEQEVVVALDDGREVRYPFASLHQLTHAYAVSVHKAQGAEFPAVVIPLLTNHAPMLGRTLLYTAVTRARQLVVVVGQRRALAMAVKDWRRTERQTALDGLLSGELRNAWPRPGAADASDDGSDGAASWEGLVGDEAAA
ncbi:MAG: RecD-like DNA helicase YrrC [uncultured Thermomicrobiales bacterium]|uniref:RecD-like DNA helicase YrrC n=1 Tax=uncultured Thermomicrobiales bacterium TaxID=1645740 RepID=A0A6J4V7Y1_9BACT|nr:MAG: RecD-like DNA helicase YrrC [uncultured Thermomicrobiales bacterium]